MNKPEGFDFWRTDWGRARLYLLCEDGSYWAPEIDPQPLRALWYLLRSVEWLVGLSRGWDSYVLSWPINLDVRDELELKALELRHAEEE